MHKPFTIYFAIILLAAVSVTTVADINSELQKTLIAMGTQDQLVREKIVPIISTLGMESDEFKNLMQEMAEIDTKNLSDLKNIISLYGWPGKSLVGEEAAKAAFLILQHAPLAEQEKLLPLFREAVAQGNALPRNLALLEDRIRLRNGQKQIYGSQVSAGPDGLPKLDPIENPEAVNQRRKSVGLPTIEEYLDILEAQLGKRIDRSALNGN